MSNKDILKLLFPVDLGDNFSKTLEVDGRALDAAQSSAERLFLEMFADSAVDTLSAWERVYGLDVALNDPVQLRKDKLLRKFRQLGDIKAPYFILLAEAFGYTVTIEPDVPAVAGWAEAGDSCYVDAAIHIWNVNVSGQPAYTLRAGDSAAGEYLLWWPTNTDLENLFNDLKAAHIYLYFIYP